MPLTNKGNKIMKNMEEGYGKEKGKKVFYASRNKGTISGVDPESSCKKAEVSISEKIMNNVTEQYRDKSNDLYMEGMRTEFKKQGMSPEQIEELIKFAQNPDQEARKEIFGKLKNIETLKQPIPNTPLKNFGKEVIKETPNVLGATGAVIAGKPDAELAAQGDKLRKQKELVDKALQARKSIMQNKELSNAGRKQLETPAFKRDSGGILPFGTEEKMKLVDDTTKTPQTQIILNYLKDLMGKGVNKAKDIGGQGIELAKAHPYITGGLGVGAGAAGAYALSHKKDKEEKKKKYKVPALKYAEVDYAEGMLNGLIEGGLSKEVAEQYVKQALIISNTSK